MRKIACAIVSLCAVVGVYADTFTYTLEADNNTTNTSAALPVSGWLDKIELSGPGEGATNSVVIATWDGTNAVDTLASVSSMTNTPKVIRLRVVPTDNEGTDLAAAFSALGKDTNASQVISIPYDKVLVGGNIKVRTINTAGNDNNLKVVFYFEPLKK